MPRTSDTRLILLGTKGGPRVGRGRSNPANVVVVNDRPYVVDCGYGVIRQLVDADIEVHEVRTILITHNHSDHMLELGPLIYSAWAGGLREHIDVWGPPPVGKIVESFSSPWHMTSTYASGTRGVPICASSCGCTNSSRNRARQSGQYLKQTT